MRRASRHHYQEPIPTATEIDAATEAEAVIGHHLADPEAEVAIAAETENLSALLEETVGTVIGTPIGGTAETVMIVADVTITEIIVAETVVLAPVIGDEATGHAAEVAIVGREIGVFAPTALVSSAEKKPKPSNGKAYRTVSRKLKSGV